jgi:uncharacterized protein YcnI
MIGNPKEAHMPDCPTPDPSDALSPDRRGRRFARRTAIVSTGVIIGFLVGTGTALAHVTIDPGTVAAGSDAILTFRVPTESQTASTVAVAVHLPTDHPFPEVHPQAIAGWTVEATSATLAAPVTEGDLTVTKAVTTVTWTASSQSGIPPEDFGEFAIAVEDVPDVASMLLAVTQTYGDGTIVEWKDPTLPGAAQPEHPAPVLTITGSSGSAEPTATSSEPSAATTQPTAPTVTATTTGATEAHTDNAARILSVIGIIMAALALVVAALGLRRHAAQHRADGSPGDPQPPAGPPNGPWSGPPGDRPMGPQQ